MRIQHNAPYRLDAEAPQIERSQLDRFLTDDPDELAIPSYTSVLWRGRIERGRRALGQGLGFGGLCLMFAACVAAAAGAIYVLGS